MGCSKLSSRQNRVGQGRTAGVVDSLKRGDACAGALHVAVVDHDVAKHLTGIQHLVPAVSAVVLVSGPAAVLVVVGQQHVAGVTQALL